MDRGIDRQEPLLSYKTKKDIENYAIAIVFILPTLLLLIAFVLIPIAKTSYLSLFAWDGIQPQKDYVGLKNFSTALGEPQFIRAVINNLIWAVMHIVFACGTGLFLAFNLTRVKIWRNLFRTVLFLPNFIALSVSAVIWAMIYNPTFGIINTVLKSVGLGVLAKSWLADPNIAIYAISMASSWQAYGYYMVLFVAGLQSIDATLYEAAEIDGANGVQQFWNVTIPGLRNVFTFVLSISMINGLKGFATVWAMTQGGPEYATYLMTLYIYKKAFLEYRYGLASAGGVILGLAIIVITVVFNRIRDRVEE